MSFQPLALSQVDKPVSVFCCTHDLSPTHTHAHTRPPLPLYLTDCDASAQNKTLQNRLKLNNLTNKQLTDSNPVTDSYSGIHETYFHGCCKHFLPEIGSLLTSRLLNIFGVSYRGAGTTASFSSSFKEGQQTQSPDHSAHN